MSVLQPNIESGVLAPLEVKSLILSSHTLSWAQISSHWGFVHPNSLPCGIISQAQETQMAGNRSLTISLTKCLLANKNLRYVFDSAIAEGI